MKPKTAIVLAAVLVVLIGYVALRQSGVLTPKTPDAQPAPQLLTVNTAELASMTISSPGRQPIELQRKGEQWLIASPIAAQADTAKAGEIVRTFREMKATAAAPQQLQGIDTGLDSPTYTAALTDSKGVSQTFTIGKQLPRIGPDVRWYVRAGGREGTYIVTADFDKSLGLAARDLRDRKLLDSSGEVVQVSVDNPAAPFDLVKVAAEWIVRSAVPADETLVVTTRPASASAPAKPLECKASEMAVNDLLSKLRYLTAERFVSETAAEARRFQPRATITVTYEDKTRRELAIGPASGTGAIVRTGGEAAIVRQAVADGLLTDAAAYWDKTLVKLPPYTKVTHMAVTRDGATVEMESKDGQWVAAGTGSSIDAALAADAAQKLTSIEATKIVAIGPVPAKYANAQGLVRVSFTARTAPPAPASAPAQSQPASAPTSAPADSPETAPATMPATASAPAGAPAATEPAVIIRRHELNLVKLDGKAYAWTAGGQAVGEIDMATFDALAADFRDKQLWTVAASDVTAVRVRGVAEPFELNRKDGGAWAASDPTFVADAAKVQSFVTALAFVRVERYATAADARGLDKPAMVIEFDAGGSTRTLSVSAVGPEGASRFAAAGGVATPVVLAGPKVEAITKTLKDLAK